MASIIDKFPDINFIEDITVADVLSSMVYNYQDKYKELTGKEAKLAQANPYRLILQACALQIYQGMQWADNAGKMSFLKYARGDYLDNLAALRGLSRLQAAQATTTLKFSIENPIESAVSIPAGCRVTNGNDVFFATDEYAEIKAGETSCTVSATCTEAGVCGNGFTPGEFNVVVNTLPYIVTVVNTVETAGGAETESDESLKERVYNVPDSYSTAGPSGAYEYWTKEASTEVGDVVVRSEIPGEVDIYFITEKGEIPGETLIEKVSDFLSDRGIRPLTDKVNVLAPDTEEYNIELSYCIPASSKSAVTTIQENVAAAVSAYNIWQTERIGRDINPSYLIQKIMEAGAKRVDIISPTFTRLSESTVAKTGTVAITYGGVEND